MQNNPYNIELQNAIAHLKGQKVIKRDKDIADALGYGKSTVSAYVNGSVRVSEEFVKKFEKEYNIKLSNFLPEKFEKYAEKVPRGTSESSIGAIPPAAWVNLSESILTLSRGIEKGQDNVSDLVTFMKAHGMNPPNSSDPSNTYSEDEVEALIGVLGRELAGKKLEGPAKFAAYAKKKLAEIRFGDAKGRVQKAHSAIQPASQEQ